MSADNKVSEEQRLALRDAVDRWLHRCATESIAAFEAGRSGHIGCFKISAYAGDDEDELTLTVQQTIEVRL